MVRLLLDSVVVGVFFSCVCICVLNYVGDLFGVMLCSIVVSFGGDLWMLCSISVSVLLGVLFV